MNNSYAGKGVVQQVMPPSPYNGSGRGHISSVQAVAPPSPYNGSGRISSVQAVAPPSSYNGGNSYY